MIRPGRTTHPVSARLLTFPAIFGIFFSLYLSTWGGHYTSGDGAQKVAWAKAMLLQRSADIDPGPGVAYSKYGVGHSLLAVPALAAAWSITSATGIRCEAALYTLLFVANGALLMALMGVYLRRYYPAERVWITLLLAGLCTMWWPYTKLDFSEALVTTALFGGFVLADGGRALAGVLVAGTAILIRTDAVIPCLLLAGMEGWRTRSLKQTAILAAGLTPAVAGVMAANYVRYGSLSEQGYTGEPFSTPLITGIHGILFSPGKSILLFSPPLLLGLAGLRRFAGTPHGRQASLFFVSVFLSGLLIYARWWDWSGDDCWGIRFLLPGTMLLCIPAVEIVRRGPLVAAVAAAGLLVQLPGVLVGGLDYLLLMRQMNPQREALYVGGTSRVDFEDIRHNPRYSQIAGNWLLIRVLLNMPPVPATRDEIVRSGTPLYDTLPPHEWKLRARWDPLWMSLWQRGN